MLDGKRILITGASKGLGAIAAKSFSEQGAKLFLVARSADLLKEVRDSCVNPEKHGYISIDLYYESTIQEVIKIVSNYFKEIDVVLHCMGGGLGYKESLLDYPQLLQLFRLNIGIASQINGLVIPDMIKRRSGNIVHVGSIASSEGVGSVGYNTTKSALAAYVRSLGRELAMYNVICTGILPGGFISPGNSMDRLKKSSPEAYNDFIQYRLPRKSMGQAKEVIPMLSLLCSSDASMMSGCMVPIDAGEGVAYNG